MSSKLDTCEPCGGRTGPAGPSAAGPLRRPAPPCPRLPRRRLRVLSQAYGVQKVDAAPGVINVTFKPNPPIDAMAVIRMIQKNQHIKRAANDKLRIEKELAEPKDRAQMVRDVLRSLRVPQPACRRARAASYAPSRRQWTLGGRAAS